MQLFTTLAGERECDHGLFLEGFPLVRRPTRNHANIPRLFPLPLDDKDRTGTGRNYLLDLEAGAARAREDGVTKGTLAKQSRSWDIWLEFLERTGHADDPLLEDLDQVGRLRMCGAFMHAKRRGDLGSRRSAQQVLAGTARSALDNVAATFVAHHHPSPIADGLGNVHRDIRRQTSGYKRVDPPREHERALQPVVFRNRLRKARHPRAKARAQLLGGALFWGLRSCEYTYVRPGDRKTRPIQVKDLVFMAGKTVLPHDHPLLAYADTLTINFGDQKTEIRNEQVTQHNNLDCELNPIVNWADTVKRLRGYPGFDPSWEVFKFYDGSFSNITATEMINDIRDAVDDIGEETLGYTSAEVGTHSVRSSLAMLMYLAGEPVYTIMLIG
mmetsp:Transcript_35267/g.79113  ORF Transcript_35267/g.79113 Transcript_35267/m.79113 type:complete len:385 (+) Transcript_35267:1924-3078(+)